VRLAILSLGGEELRADLARPLDLSIPLEFDGPQPAHFGAAAASARPLEVGGFVGDTRRGGSCNCSEYRLVPHCNGTHTECVGHVTDERVSVRDALRPGLWVALLMTVTPVTAPGSGDPVVTRALLEEARARGPARDAEAWVIRTEPNPPEKMRRHYLGTSPAPYLTSDAVALAVACGIEHLVLDLPSLDRSHDEGQLAGHRIFWGMPPGSRALASARRPRATITELAFIPAAVPDGQYFLELGIAPFASDAAPSRPVLFPVIARHRALAQAP
jgi:arylformamidase